MAETKKRGPGRPPGSKNKNSSNSGKSNASGSAQKKSATKEEHIEQMRLKYEKDMRTIDIIWSITFIAIGIFFGFTVLRKSTGDLGAGIRDICMGLFGIMAYVLPFMIVLSGVLLMMGKLQHIGGRTAFCSVLIFISMCMLNSYRFIEENRLAFGFDDIVKYYKMGVAGDKGGAIGMELGSLVVKGFGKVGLLIVAITVLIICIFLVANTPISKFFENMSRKRENRKMLSELEAAEQAKVQAAVASTVTPTMTTPPMTATPRETVAPQAVPVNREADLKDTYVVPVQKSSDGFFGRFRKNSGQNQQPVDAGKYDSETVGTATTNNNARTGYGLVDDDNYGKSGSYGLGLDDGYSSYNKKANTGQSTGLKSEPEKPKRVINNGGLETATAVAATNAVNTAKKAVKNPVVTDPVDTAKVAAAVGVTNALKQESKKDKAAKDAEAEQLGDEMNAALSAATNDDNYSFPPVNLLKAGSANKHQMTDIQLEQKADLLEQTLRDFGVEATVLEVTQGASVTRYEVQPATGVKVSSITKLADDIALNLRAKTIRIEAPIPGKAAVGIEVENDKPSPVVVRDLIESPEFMNSESKISFIVGKDISGKNIVADLKSMPHLLIAGATGSGKSVCINTIIASFLYKAKPSELKLIMVDPKVVELQSYNGIPHMLVPVVTDPRKASKALAIAVQEMDKRYEAFAKIGVKDLDSYNDYMRGEQEYANVKPQIVIIIDELADLMMACSNEVETSICRLAQKARAAGMHLIVATQRPSVDVVTGLIKANIPSRIAFSVSSSTDSRTILDMGGAEKLLGKGDMLFSPVGSNKPYRVQGPFITEAETNKLIKFVKQQGGNAVYDQEVQNAIESDGKANSGSGEMEDDLTEDAIAFILHSKQASVSMLQRRFRIGYNRAARIIDEIEEMGIIGPSDGSRPRQVLVTEDEYYGNNDESQEGEVQDVQEAHAEVVNAETVSDASSEDVAEAVDVEYIPVVDEDATRSALDAFNSLPESERKKLLSTDD